MGFTEMNEERFKKIEKEQTFLRRMLLVQIMFCGLLFCRVLHLRNQ